MKKIALISIMLILFLNLSIPAYALTPTTANEDSLIVNDAIRTQFQTQEDDMIIRIYNVGIRFAFTENDDIADVLASNYALEILYVIQREDGTYESYFEDGEPVLLPNPIINDTALEALRSDEIIRNVATDIVVHNTYYLSGESSHMGTAIYYVTDKGDYVYYNHYSIGERLFPVDAFCEFQQAIHEEYRQQPINSSGNIDINNIWDLSAYDFNSSAFDLNAKYPGQKDEVSIGLWIGVSVSACLLIACIALGVIHLHKRKTNRTGDGFA